MTRPTSRLVRVNDRGYPVGEDHHRSKLTNHEVDLVLELLADGMSHRAVAGKMEISRAHVGRIARGEKRSQLITTTVRRPVHYFEPEFQPVDLSEFDIVPGFF